MRRTRRLALASLAGCLLLMGAAPTARAANLGIASGSMEFIDVAAQANNASLTRSATNYTVTDVVPIVAAAPCVNVIATVATCPVASVTDRILFFLGDNNDRAQVDGTITPVGDFSEFDVQMEGGDGNDVLIGAPNAFNRLFGQESFSDGPGDDSLTGGRFTDLLFASDGTDTVNAGGEGDIIDGGLGTDTLNGGGGPDFFGGFFFGLLGVDGPDRVDGGRGIDQLTYGRATGVSVRLNGVADDGDSCPGPGCEGDNILPSVEFVGGGDGNDTLVGNSRSNGFFGGDGDDTIDTGAGDDSVLSGGDGRDVLRAGAGDDLSINGGEGEDRMFGGAGDDSFLSTILTDDPDVLDGGKGIDLVDYTQADGAVRVSLDGRANDGVEDENDNVHADIEDIAGTPEADVLIGSKRPNDIVGNDGNDRIIGKGGLDGIDGGRGDDRISGGKGRDLLEGDAGRDRIAARDGGPDQVFCGSSFDLVIADRGDRTAADCDKVKRRRR